MRTAPTGLVSDWNPSGGRTGLIITVGCSLLIEGALIACLLLAGRHPVREVRLPRAIHVILRPSPPEPRPAPPVLPQPRMISLPVPPPPLPDLVIAPRPVPTPPQPVAQPRPMPPVARLEPARPAPVAAAPAPPPPAAAPSAAEAATFEAALRRAVQQALIFPAGAQAAHEQGVAHVRFTYRDGQIEDAVLVRSTGFPILDGAALQTVRVARYPATPARFAGRPLRIDVDVVFQVGDESDTPD